MSDIKYDFKKRSEQVSEVFRKNLQHHELVDELGKMGFIWVKDDKDPETIEENAAKPENARQKLLVAYFEDRVTFSDKIAEAFLQEKYSNNTNYPLIRKYFKKGNEALKLLLEYILENDSTNIDILNDLSFFHRHRPMLTKVIQFYKIACLMESDLEKFRDLAVDFYYNTEMDGYESFWALKEMAKDLGKKKEKIIDDLLESEVIDFENITVH
jgi:hypothetical protein